MKTRDGFRRRERRLRNRLPHRVAGTRQIVARQVRPPYRAPSIRTLTRLPQLSHQSRCVTLWERCTQRNRRLSADSHLHLELPVSEILTLCLIVRVV